MSVTSRSLGYLTSNHNITMKGSVSGDTTTMYLYFHVSHVTESVWDSDKETAPALKIYVDGALQTIKWTSSLTAYDSERGRRFVMTAATNSFTINKPFFRLKIEDNWVVRDFPLVSTYDAFSFYDVEYGRLEGEPEEGTCEIIDGVTATKVNFVSGLLDTPITKDGDIKVTWSAAGGFLNAPTHTYVQNIKGVTSTSYVIPQSWADVSPNNNLIFINCNIEVSYAGYIFSSEDCTIIMRIPDDALPKINSVTLGDLVDTPVPATWGNLFIQGQSGLRIKEIDCEPTPGANITNIQLLFGTLPNYREGWVLYDSANLPSISSISESGDLDVVIAIQDSRLLTTYITTSINVIPWSRPKFTTVNSNRCTAEGEEDNDGTYFLSNTTAEYSSCNGHNNITLSMSYKLTSDSEYSDPITISPGTNVCGGGNINTEYAYDVVYTLQDAFVTVPYLDYVSTAVYLLHFLHGGNGIAFGQKATTPNLLDCAFDARFRNNVTFAKEDGTEITLLEILDSIQQGGGSGLEQKYVDWIKLFFNVLSVDYETDSMRTSTPVTFTTLSGDVMSTEALYSLLVTSNTPPTWRPIDLKDGTTNGSVANGGVDVPSYCIEPNGHVRVRASCAFTQGSGTHLLGDGLPAPSSDVACLYTLNGTGWYGRAHVDTSGQLISDWIFKPGSATKQTGSIGWTDIQIDYFVDWS